MTDAEEKIIKKISNFEPNEIIDKMIKHIYWYIGIAIATWICGYIQTACLMTTAQR